MCVVGDVDGAAHHVQTGAEVDVPRGVERRLNVGGAISGI